MKTLNAYRIGFQAALWVGIVGCAYMLMTSGCATLGQVSTPSRVKAITKLAAYTSCVQTAGVTGAGRENWLRAYTALLVMRADGNWDAATLGAALERAGVAEMIGSEGQLLIGAGVSLLDAFSGTITQIGSNELVRAVIDGALEGIDLALNDALSPLARDTHRAQHAAEIAAKLKAEAEATRGEPGRDKPCPERRPVREDLGDPAL